LQPEYGRFVTAFCGTFWPAVADCPSSEILRQLAC
jgi:hypothetical protein